MGTLVLGAAGAALGGPWGAAIGGMLGQSIDRNLFGQVRQGPRLGDLAVQTSQYGSWLPRVYGTMRVAGTVIWATDLQETGVLTSSGKAGPQTASYAYSASFAVALSSRDAVSVRRIWADGKLLRGVAGDFKVRTGFRFYTGSEDQDQDPLIASVEGLEKTPAFRGLAFAVFEQLQLESFGNRIPVLTFELVAERNGVPVSNILSDLIGSHIQPRNDHELVGYAAYGRDLSEALSPLLVTSDATVGGLRCHDRIGRSLAIPTDALGCSAIDGEKTQQYHRTSSSDLPAALSLTYHDIDRDYQLGEKHCSIAAGTRHESIELPAVLTSEQAKTLVDRSLKRRWARRERRTVNLPLQYIDLAPGDTLRFDKDGEWHVDVVTIADFVVTAECHRDVTQHPATNTADPGRALSAPDHVPSPTVLHLFQLPADVGGADSVRVRIAASGHTRPWRAVPVRIEAPGLDLLASTATSRSILGTTKGELAEGLPGIIDESSTLEVHLIEPEDWLQSCDEEALFMGSNLALVGAEVIQFASAESLGNAKFRLSRFMRGCLNTGEATTSHTEGETFCLLQRGTIAVVDLPSASAGRTIQARSLSLGDDKDPGMASLRLSAVAQTS